MKGGGGDRIAAWAPIVAGLVVLAAAIAALTPQPAGVFWDDGVYLITARALAQGEGYRFTHLAGAPAAVHFPPLWPFVLSLAWRIVPEFPRNLGILTLIPPVLCAVAAALTCAFGVRALKLPPAVAVVAAVTGSLTLPVMIFAGVLFSEPLCLVLALAALMTSARIRDDDRIGLAVAAGACAGLCTLARSTGLVVVLAVPVAYLVARRPRHAAVALAAAVAFVLPWQLWSSAHAGELAMPMRGSYGPYLPWLLAAVREHGARFVALVARQNVTSLERSVAIVFFPAGLREVRPLLVALLAVVGTLGLVAAWRRAAAMVVMLVAYALVIAIWPYAPDRFAWGVWPLVCLVLAAGAHEAWRIARRAGAPAAERMAAGLLVALACIAALGDAFYTARGVSRGWADVAQRRNAALLVPVIEWIRAHAPEDATVATDGEPLVHLYTGRRVVPVQSLSAGEYLAGTPQDVAAADLRALIGAGGADLAVFSAGAAEAAGAPLLVEGPDYPRLTLIDTLPGGGTAFKVVKKP